MVPFEIQFEFASPMVRGGDHPIYLDALIAFGVMRELEEMGSEDPWKESEDLSAYLDKTDGTDDKWVWKASRLEFSPLDSPFFINSVRRSDPERVYEGLTKGEWQQTRKADKFTVNTRSGQLRGYQRLIVAQWVTAKAWGIGDIDAVKSAFQHISYIGKEGRNGYGRLSNVIVREAEESTKGNWMLRALPEKPSNAPREYYPVLSALRPPYWNKQAYSQVVEPL